MCERKRFHIIEITTEEDKKLFDQLLEMHPAYQKTDILRKIMKFYLKNSPYIKYTKKEEEPTRPRKEGLGIMLQQ